MKVFMSLAVVPLLLVAGVQGCSGEAPSDAVDSLEGHTRHDQDAGSAEPTRGDGDADGGANTRNDAGGDAADAAPPRDAGGKSTMTFFVTSTGSNAGGNLGGLVGADAKCLALATAVGGGDHTWRAYLSTSDVHAKDRIGPGPWKNQKGVVIPPSAVIHTGKFEIMTADILDEKGALVPTAQRHVYTGTYFTGTAFVGKNCDDWTSSANGKEAVVGNAVFETKDSTNDTWCSGNYAFCTPAGFNSGHLNGRFYCFATD